jgi:hypothetical protein
VTFDRKTLDSRLRGNDGKVNDPRAGADPVTFDRKTLDSRLRGNDGK